MSETFEQIILTEVERQQMVAEGYRRVRLRSDGSLQVAKEVVPMELYSELKDGTPGAFTMRWDWVNWPRKKDSEVPPVSLKPDEETGPKIPVAVYSKIIMMCPCGVNVTVESVPFEPHERNSIGVWAQCKRCRRMLKVDFETSSEPGKNFPNLEKSQVPE